MITPVYVQMMARYNEGQNKSLYAAADSLLDADRRKDLGAFFGSVHATLNHILWADHTWMSRFAGLPAPAGAMSDSTRLHEDWESLRAARKAFDAEIIAWSEKVDPKWLLGHFSWYSGMLKAEMSRPTGQLVTHMFNHQTHHRGQVHALLTRLGAKTESTDLAFMTGI
jgi:uncharacterized damage-inducible protein DinB